MLPKHVRYQLRYAEIELLDVADFGLAISRLRNSRIAWLSCTPKIGSRGWKRSSDLSLIKRVLYRLSYATKEMAPRLGLEPRTSALTVRRSTN